MSKEAPTLRKISRKERRRILRSTKHYVLGRLSKMYPRTRAVSEYRSTVKEEIVELRFPIPQEADGGPTEQIIRDVCEDAETQLCGVIGFEAPSSDTRDETLDVSPMDTKMEGGILYFKYALTPIVTATRYDAEVMTDSLLSSLGIHGDFRRDYKRYWSQLYKAKIELSGETLQSRIRSIDDLPLYRILDSELKEKIKALVFQKEPLEEKPKG